MTTTKSYTDIEQSKKLAEILPLESADMYYLYVKDNNHIVNPQPFVADGFEEREEGFYTYLNCWSLAALLKFIPKHIKNVNVLRIDIDEKDFSIWYDEIGCGVNIELPDITMENPVDACYELIIKLHELNLL